MVVVVSVTVRCHRSRGTLCPTVNEELVKKKMKNENKKTYLSESYLCQWFEMRSISRRGDVVCWLESSLSSCYDRLQLMTRPVTRCHEGRGRRG
jgi:hypothetical protein